jgi:hypothetical protein
MGNLMGPCNAAEIQTPRANIILMQRDTVSDIGNQWSCLDPGQGFRDAFTAVFDGNDLPTIEFPSIEPDAINQANSLLFPDPLPLQSVEEDEAIRLAPQPAAHLLSHTQPFSGNHINHRELSLLRSLFCRQNSQGPLAQHFPTVFLRVGSDPNGVFPVEGGVLGDLEFLRIVINGGNDGETSVGADPIVVLSLWEAYVWQVMETNSMLQSLLMRVDWATKQCSSSSVMFTRCFLFKNRFVLS